MKEAHTFGPSGYARHEHDKQPGSYIENAVGREQERDADFMRDVDALVHGGVRGKSLPESMIEHNEPVVEEVRKLMQHHDATYFTEDRCEKMFEKFEDQVTQKEIFRALAETLEAREKNKLH